jgi:hypothetical protein
MRKAIPVGLCLFTLLAVTLSACQLGMVSESTEAESAAQTLVAIAATQTAIAAPQEQAATEEDIPVEETAEETEAPATEVPHNITPGEPGWIYKWFYDTNSTANANNGYVTGGDDFVANLYERPFTETEMTYRPDVDITKAEISSDDTFYYVILTLSGQNPEGGLQAAYGVEIDADRNGRGDLLVIANRPTTTDWAIEGVSVHRDPNKDVGGASIMRPDSSYSGDGYEETVFSLDVLDDPDAAWARVSLGTPPTVTLAFKKSLVSMGTFVWGVWAADSLLDPALIDLHDNFTEAEAGSPYQAHSTYPLKALNLVDNTCRETYGFDAETPIAGLCYLPEEEVPEPTPTYTPAPGSITGVAFDDTGVEGDLDSDNNGHREAGEPLTVYSVTVSLHEGSCANPVIGSTNAKSFTFSGLPAGQYCVNITPSGNMTTPSSQTVTIAAGGTAYVEFGYYVVQ